MEHELDAALSPRVDHPLDQQVNYPGLLLRVEHIPELSELCQSGGHVAGIDGRLLGGFQFRQPLVQKGSAALQSRRSLWPIKQLTQACSETPPQPHARGRRNSNPRNGFLP